MVADLTHTAIDADNKRVANPTNKYFGVCALPLSHKRERSSTGDAHSVAHRIDFQVINKNEWPFALLYFTGSDHMNRSMRLYARRHGLSLNEKALVKRLGVKGDLKGDPIPGIRTEADIFKALGLEYLPPDQRN